MLQLSQFRVELIKCPLQDQRLPVLQSGTCRALAGGAAAQLYHNILAGMSAVPHMRMPTASLTLAAVPHRHYSCVGDIDAGKCAISPPCHA